MDTNMTDGNGRRGTQQSGGQPPRPSQEHATLRELLGLPLGVVLALILLYFFVGITWGIADVGSNLEGWRSTDVNWLTRQVSCLTSVLVFLIPMATTLGAKAVFSGAETRRRLWRWAVAVGSITGILVVLDVLALWIAGHLAGLY